jgi:hypothetical protein
MHDVSGVAFSPVFGLYARLLATVEIEPGTMTTSSG